MQDSEFAVPRQASKALRMEAKLEPFETGLTFDFYSSSAEQVFVYKGRLGVSARALSAATRLQLEAIGVDAVDSAFDATITASGLHLELLDEGADVESTDSEGDNLLPLKHVSESVFTPLNGVADVQTLPSRNEQSNESLVYHLATREGVNTIGVADLMNPLTGDATNSSDSKSTKRRRDRKAKGHGANSKRRALYRKAITISNNLEVDDLGHSSQGYIGLEEPLLADPHGELPGPMLGPLPACVPDGVHPEALALLRGLYALVPSHNGPTLFTDSEGRIIAWRLGSMGSEAGTERCSKRERRMCAALESLASKVRQKKSAGVPRGKHNWAHWEYSYGGGKTKPTRKQQKKKERKAWMDFLSTEDYNETAKIVQDSWLTWAPDIYHDYHNCHTALLSRDPSLDRVCPTKSSVDLPFASVTGNLGPQTVCDHHKDLKNRANGGLCIVKTLGQYDWKRGGHIVLHNLGLVVEMKPGDIIFFPSALISHSTIPIVEGEMRYSLVWYSAGGLFRWKDAGFQSHVEWQQKSPAEWKKHQKEGDLRWNQGWKRYLTLEELVARATVSTSDGKPGQLITLRRVPYFDI